jgi:arylsulfatase
LDLEPPTSIKGVTQSPLEGVSFAHTFDDINASSRHKIQYFEMLGHRSIFRDGWRAVCPWPGTSFTESGQAFGTPIPAEKLTELDATAWELYHVAEDFAENYNVAAENHPRLIEMIAQWYVEAGKYNVLPVDGRGQQRFADERPQIAADRSSYTFYSGTQEVPVNAAAQIINRPHSITADVEIPVGGAEGVLISQGGIDGGYSFYIKDGKLQYLYNYVARTFYHAESTQPIPQGRHKLRYEFEVTGAPDILQGKGTPGRGQLYIDGRLVGQVEMEVTNPIVLGLASGVAIGADPGSPVTDRYQGAFEFTGTIYNVTIDVSGDLIRDTEAEMRAIMARQ